LKYELILLKKNKFMKKILIVSVTGMGDSLWGTPGIRALKKFFPKAEIDLLVNRPWKSLFENNPHLNEIFEYHPQWYRQPFVGMRLLGRHYDAIYIFHSNLNFRRMLPWLRSATIWSHQDGDWIPETHRVKIDVNVHGIERRMIMLRKIGVKPDGGQMEIFFDQITLDESKQVLHAHGFSPKKYIYLNLGASAEKKRWMVERFSELARRILNETPWNVMLGGGGPVDHNRSLAILSQLNSPRVSTACSHPLLVSADIISKARLMVTTDTGPMHIGFAVRTPVLGLFGASSPKSSGPYEIPDHLCRVITIKSEGQVSYDDENIEESNFRHVTVNRVWAEVEKMLADKSIK
jgi:ADP-heptose:LPS heptosyltransferase